METSERTFVPIDDDALADRIALAKRRIVYVAPGVGVKVADAIGRRLGELEQLDITVVLDPEEDVCRIGYGDEQGLKRLHELASVQHVALRKQAGLRIGVLVIDEDVVIWSPTPRSVEAARKRFDTPNGIVLGRDPATALISAIVPEGTDSVITEAEIGVEVVTPADVQETVEAIKRNPIIPVELAQVTRVFSTKLQFVELEVTNAKMSKMSLSIPRPLLNADAAKEIKLLIDGQLKAFGEFREVAINVPAFTTDGQASFDRDRNRQTARVSEADLEQVRHNIERRFLYPIVGHGMLISRDEKPAFEVVVKALETQLTAYWNGVREDLTAQSGRIIDQAVQLIKARLTTGGQPPTESFLSDVQKTLLASLNRRTTSEPTVRTKYKDVTFEHTQSDEFRDKVQRALPSHVQNQLGAWVKHFKAARQAMS